MPPEHTGTEVSSPNSTDDSLPVPAPASQTRTDIPLHSEFELPISSVPPSLARSATEPYPKGLPEATTPVSALSDPKVGHVLIVDDNDINLKVRTPHRPTVL